MQFKSTTELLAEIEILQNELASSGHKEANALVKEGLAGVNGLTDGWAYLLENLNQANHKYGASIEPIQHQRLLEIQKVIHGLVCRG